MDWTASDGAAWLSVSPTQRDERGHDHGDAVDHRPGGRHLHDRHDASTASGATGSPKTIPVTLTVDPPTPPALSVTPASLAFTRDGRRR